MEPYTLKQSTSNFPTEGQPFTGDVKTSTSFLSPLEKRLARSVLPKAPAWIETYHLTLMTPVWSLLIVIFSHLARTDLSWLWLVSAMIVGHYITDFFDGKLGKYRDTGLIKWGFYMDHFLDYFFLCSVLTGYAMILPDSSRYHLFFMLAVCGGFMLNAFLVFAATGRFSISHLKFGPTEFHIALIIINALLTLHGTTEMIKALPYVAGVGSLLLGVIIITTQRKFWTADMERKRKESSAKQSV